MGEETCGINNYTLTYRSNNGLAKFSQIPEAAPFCRGGVAQLCTRVLAMYGPSDKVPSQTSRRVYDLRVARRFYGPRRNICVISVYDPAVCAERLTT